MDISSPSGMTAAIRHYGILPFFKSSVEGWSVQDMTRPGFWFDDDDAGLGPWDWKIDVVQQGDIAYGKFIGGKAAFATVEWYAHLMNWRRSLPRYRMAVGENWKADSNSDKLMQVLAPAVYKAIAQGGAMEASQLRIACTQAVTPALLEALGEKYEHLLVPNARKSICDSVMQFLQMGTWSLVGAIERVYRGPDKIYSGWQHAINTTPEDLFCEEPAIVRPTETGCTPGQSREKIIRHIQDMFPDSERETLLKLI